MEKVKKNQLASIGINWHQLASSVGEIFQVENLKNNNLFDALHHKMSHIAKAKGTTEELEAAQNIALNKQSSQEIANVKSICNLTLMEFGGALEDSLTIVQCSYQEVTNGSRND